MVHTVAIYIDGLPITHKIKQIENLLKKKKTCQQLWNQNKPVFIKVLTTFDTNERKIPRTYSEMVLENKQSIYNIINETTGNAIITFTKGTNLYSIIDKSNNQLLNNQYKITTQIMN